MWTRRERTDWAASIIGLVLVASTITHGEQWGLVLDIRHKDRDGLGHLFSAGVTSIRHFNLEITSEKTTHNKRNGVSALILRPQDHFHIQLVPRLHGKRNLRHISRGGGEFSVALTRGVAARQRHSQGKKKVCKPTRALYVAQQWG